MTQDTIKKLQASKTLGELLKVIHDEYEVEKTIISPIVKGTIISGLQMAVKMTNCKKRT